jgi:hypothetical protein
MTEVVEEVCVQTRQRANIFQQLLPQALLVRRESSGWERYHSEMNEYSKRLQQSPMRGRAEPDEMATRAVGVD